MRSRAFKGAKGEKAEKHQEKEKICTEKDRFEERNRPMLSKGSVMEKTERPGPLAEQMFHVKQLHPQVPNT